MLRSSRFDNGGAGHLAKTRGYVETSPTTLLQVARLKTICKTRKIRTLPDSENGMNNNELINMLRSGNQYSGTTAHLIIYER